METLTIDLRTSAPRLTEKQQRFVRKAVQTVPPEIRTIKPPKPKRVKASHDMEGEGHVNLYDFAE